MDGFPKDRCEPHPVLDPHLLEKVKVGLGGFPGPVAFHPSGRLSTGYNQEALDLLKPLLKGFHN